MSHPEALEVLYWHDMYATSQPERSDDSFFSLRKLELVEKRPAPLDLTEAEQLEFLAEYCAGYQHVAATEHTAQVYIVWSDWFETTRARTLSEAICLAAAKWGELNR